MAQKSMLIHDHAVRLDFLGRPALDAFSWERILRMVGVRFVRVHARHVLHGIGVLPVQRGVQVREVGGSVVAACGFR
ncbi:hypothetical protein AWC31_09160 [Mycolicibacterium wolinskyi]|uniref:Uncharacterized protein n=1 Tax=Mycolicibacterium wolinskyi TaxID=59750 RepID=A0A1X2ESH8_9MYCO|nr:hypothetical protein AWC31_09160 [Mycolicibacterium wolinskyi]